MRLTVSAGAAVRGEVLLLGAQARRVVRGGGLVRVVRVVREVRVVRVVRQRVRVRRRAGGLRARRRRARADRRRAVAEPARIAAALHVQLEHTVSCSRCTGDAYCTEFTQRHTGYMTKYRQSNTGG